jgi:PPOX class probable F420-dependent enzyme
MAATREQSLSDAQRRFLENPFVGVVTTLREDGSPHSTVVWVDVLDDGTPSFNTARKRVKDRNIKADPRVSLVVVDPGDAYRWVAITGRAELTEEGADAQIDKLAKKYLGKDEYPWRQPGQVRVSVRITPDRIESTGIE